MIIPKSDVKCNVKCKAVNNIKEERGEGGGGGGGLRGRGSCGAAPRSHICFTDDLTLQMQELNLFENKIIL